MEARCRLGMRRWMDGRTDGRTDRDYRSTFGNGGLSSERFLRFARPIPAYSAGIRDARRAIAPSTNDLGRLARDAASRAS